MKFERFLMRSIHARFHMEGRGKFVFRSDVHIYKQFWSSIDDKYKYFWKHKIKNEI